jgi:UDP-N-acetylmuramate--alanine ligase
MMSANEQSPTDFSGRKIHFIGIGGAGMSGLALVCSRLGAAVTGSDRADSSYMERLRGAGLEPAVGHDAGNLPEAAVLVVSTAIAVDNPELSRARELGLTVRTRGELLAELCSRKRLIAVAGTHGKTTTAAMTAWALRALGADPAFFVGGEVPAMGEDGEAANAGWGEGEWVVAEADESDGSFLELRPEVAVVTNVEMDHHSHWGSVAELRDAFERFVAEARVAEFDAGSPGPAELLLAVPGEHNVLNARAALAAIAETGADVAAAADAIADFPGVRRRLERKGDAGGAAVYDDYAHHPTELRAALAALRGLGGDRLIAVFQPHLYSRTKAFAAEFGAALALADEAIVLDVYPAREEPVGELEGVSGLMVARAAADRMGGRPVIWAPTLDGAREAARRRLAPGRVLATIGAGDVCAVADALVAEAA